MNSIGAIPATIYDPKPAGRSTASTKPGPNDLVGTGRGSARALGGVLGLGAGIGSMLGIQALASRSTNLPVRIAGSVVSLAALGGGVAAGQHLMGLATRSTAAEAGRAEQAKLQDAEIQVRLLRADAGGQLDRAAKQRVEELRAERIEALESKPVAGTLAKWALPIATGAALAVGAGVLAGKLSPDDGKGITSMFNSLMAGSFGGVGGAWAGYELAQIVGSGERHAELPTGAQDRIDAIDQELDRLLGFTHFN